MPGAAIAGLFEGLGGIASSAGLGGIASGLAAAASEASGFSGLIGASAGGLFGESGAVLGGLITDAASGAVIPSLEGLVVGALTGHPLQGFESGALFGGLDAVASNVLGDIPGLASFFNSNLGHALVGGVAGAGSSSILGGNPIQGAILGAGTSMLNQSLSGQGGAAPAGGGAAGGQAVAAPSGVGAAVGGASSDVTLNATSSGLGLPTSASGYDVTGQGPIGPLSSTSGSPFTAPLTSTPDAATSATTSSFLSNPGLGSGAANGVSSTTGFATPGNVNMLGTPSTSASGGSSAATPSATGSNSTFLNSNVGTPTPSTGSGSMDYTLNPINPISADTSSISVNPYLPDVSGLNAPGAGLPTSISGGNPYSSALSGLGGPFNALLAASVLARGEGTPPYSGQIESAAQQAGQEGQLLTQEAMAGILPPGEQATLDAQRQAAIASILSSAGARGGLGSSATQQDINYTGAQEAGTEAGILQQMLAQGANYMNMSTADYEALARERQTQDAQFSQALAMLTGNLGGLGRSPYSYPTQTVPGP